MNSEFFSWKRKIESDVERLKTQEFSRVIPLVNPVLVYSDAAARNNAFTTNVTVAGVGGIPTNVRGIWYSCVFGLTNTQPGYLDIIHPDKTIGAAAVGAQIAGQYVIGGFVGIATSGANVGKFTLIVNGTVNPVFTGIFIRVYAYLM